MKNNSIESYTDDIIDKYLRDDVLNRSKYVNSMSSILENIEQHMILNLDGNWGTGKTVFLKQLENKLSSNEEHRVLYFNSWENDMNPYPLQAIFNEMFYKFIETDNNLNTSSVTNSLRKLSHLVGKISVSAISHGHVKLEDISDLLTEEKFEIPPVIEQKNEVKKIITALAGNKKLFIFIDELDRCRPSFAIELLELVKHFFELDNVIFLFATNKNELASTVKKCYGYDFDGFGYLNRFFDIEFALPTPNIENFLKIWVDRRQLKERSYLYKAILSICQYFNFSLREINRYTLAVDMIFDWIKYDEKDIPGDQINFIRWVFLPFTIAIKMRDRKSYNELILGENSTSLLKYCEENSEIFRKMIEVNHSAIDDFDSWDYTKEIDAIMNYLKKIVGKENNQPVIDPLINHSELNRIYLNQLVDALEILTMIKS